MPMSCYLFQVVFEAEKEHLMEKKEQTPTNSEFDQYYHLNWNTISYTENFKS